MTAEPPSPRVVGRPAPPVAVAGSSSRSAPEGFDAVYRADWRPVVALGWSLTGDRSVAEELAQEAFLSAYRRWDHVGSLDKPGAWIRRAVANRAIDHHRRTQVAAKGADRLRAVERLRPVVDDGHLAAEHESFWAAVRALPARQAQCVALHYLEDRSVDDIAAVLDCRPATVRVHLHRGRQTLARTIAPATGGPTSEEPR